MTKKQLEESVEFLKEQVDEYRRKYNKASDDAAWYMETVERQSEIINKLKCKIYFLAWMLIKEWVRVDEYCWELSVNFVIYDKEWKRMMG